MLLRRITQHVKDQNWFAVFIDFIIVIVGILIAFQINTWSVEQADKRTLKTSLELLSDELKTNIATIDEKYKLHSEISTAAKDLLKIVKQPELSKVPMSLIGKVFADGYTTDYSTSALNYVLEQQPFQNTKNTVLRNAISRLPAQIEDALDDERITIHLLDNHWVPYISQHVPVEEFWKEVFVKRDWELDVSTKRSAAYAINSTIEFKQLASTLKFRNEVVNRIGYQALVLTEQKQLRDAFLTALSLIEEELQ